MNDEWQKLGVGNNPPPYILDGSALQALHPDGPEQHGANGWALDSNGWWHCLNPKCGHRWTPEEEQQLEAGGVTCPECGFYVSRDKLERMGQEGGSTKSGLTLAEMGRIAEEVVGRMGELPGVGPITWRSTAYHNPIDLRVLSQQDGVEYGCEVKSQHSQGKGYFWAGSPRDIKATLSYCMQNGMKPALVGVRLNFFNDKANIFFRPGLSNTWIGNDKMRHVATVDFSDLNPFKTAEQKDALLQQGGPENGRVDTNAPGYDFEKDLDAMFGPARVPGALAKTAWDEHDHPRDSEGQFVAKKAIHELVVKDHKGNHQHTIKRCQHCGFTYKREPKDQGRIECPTCGNDPERKLRLTKVVVGRDPVRDAILANSWTYANRTSNGHHNYQWTGPDGTQHNLITGATNQPGHTDMTMEMDRAKKRMAKCMSGQCAHPQYVPPEVEEGAIPGTPLIKAGQEVKFGDGRYFVMEVDGSLALIYDGQTGAEDVVPVTQLQAVASLDDDDEGDDPEYMFVHYLNKLIVEPWHHNLRATDLVDRLFMEIGFDIPSVEHEIDPAEVVVGVVRDGKVRIDSATRPDANKGALAALAEWATADASQDEWQTLRTAPDDWESI